MLIIGKYKMSKLAENIGYSLLASLVATIIIDIGNTRARVDAEFQQHEALTEELRYAINDLKDTVVMQYESYNENTKGNTNFEQCIDYLLTLEYKKTKSIKTANEEFMYIGESIARPINRIKRACEMLDKTIYYNTDISILPKEERKKIRTIGKVASMIDKSFEVRKYRFGMKNIIKKLLPAIYEYDDKLKDEFENNISIDEF